MEIDILNLIFKNLLFIHKRNKDKSKNVINNATDL